jgi:hypothetical protein
MQTGEPHPKTIDREGLYTGEISMQFHQRGKNRTTSSGYY